MAPLASRPLAAKSRKRTRKLNRYYLTVLASAALGFILLMVGRPTLSRGAVVVLMLFCLALLAGGVLSPMLEVEARVTKIDATLLGTPIEFHDQSLYYRSKTVFEVFQTLIHMGRPEMTLVGVLVILFSVVFPTLKMLALGAASFRPALLRTNRFVKLLAFELSKWSMADVMVLAIFMSFVAFNGVIGSAFDGLRGVPNVQQVLIPTNASKILPGYYLFIGFCVASIPLSRSSSAASLPAPPLNQARPLWGRESFAQLASTCCINPTRCAVPRPSLTILGHSFVTAVITLTSET